MKYFIYFLLFAAVLVETTLVPYPLTMVFNFLLFPYLERRMYFLSFISGILLDLFSGRLIGTDSLIFLAIIFIREILNRQIRSKNVTYQIIYLAMFLLPYNYFFYRYNFRANLLFLTVCSLVLYLSYRLFPYDMKDKRKLAL